MIPQGWEEKRLTDVIGKVKYTTKIKSKQYKEKGAYPIISQEDVFINGYWDNPNDVYHINRPVVIFGDHTKVVKYVDFDFVLGADGVKILAPLALINAKFLYYWAKFIPLRNLGYARHYKLLADKMICYPSLPEQERIVAKLDKAFEAINKVKANAEQNLNNAKKLFESALDKAFKKTDNIEQLKLDDIAEITSSKRIYKNEYSPFGIPFYRTKEIKELAHNLPISLELYISTDKYLEIKNKFGIPLQNDLLISAVGTIGEIYIVQANDKFYFKDGNIIWFRKYKKEINAEYLKYCLTAFVKEIQNMTQGAAYNALTIEKLKEYKINVVDIEEQNVIVKKIKNIRNNIDKLEAIYTQKIKECDELKQSILQKAFRGEL